MSEIGDVVQVKDLQDTDYILISDSQDVEAVLQDLRWSPEKIKEESVGCLIMRVAECGDYEEVWSIFSSVPYLKSYAERIE